ncbi:MAG TPA: 4Fe-4S dicluster domain-containing protein [Bryobacteraceae bacterium]|nr:4Fe-4S dicluster domain-containing protein [Bryobacteraceae bacterium]
MTNHAGNNLVQIQGTGRATVDLKSELERLKTLSGSEYWRELQNLASSGTVGADLLNELPWREMAGAENGLDRRNFFRLMGASLALAGLTGCTKQPPEKIVPWVVPPAEMPQGTPLFFATAMPFGGAATGLLVKSFMGRPIKIEGNPRHPASLGGTDRFAQASILDLYDPDRSQAILHRGGISSWIVFLGHVSRELQRASSDQGAGLRILTGTVNSPTLGRQIRDILARFPAAKWIQWDPTARDNAFNGAVMAFGQPVNAVYQLAKARTILSLDSDFLTCGPGTDRYAREFAQTRGTRGGANMSRLYVVESSPTSTGAAADHRLPLRCGQMEAFVRGVAQAVGAPGGANPPAEHARFVQAVAKDLQSSRSASVVIPGDWQPPVLHALAHAINAAIGAPGTTLLYTDPIEANPVDHLASLRELVGEMRAGRVDTLVITGTNPVYSAPADFRFAEALDRVRLRIHHGLHFDETARLCHWHVPDTHYLESWSDARAFDGTASIIQPLIAPLYNGRSAHEIANALLGQPDRSGYDTVRGYWRGQQSSAEFELFWRRALYDGVIPNSAAAPRTVSVRGDLAAQASSRPEAKGYEIVFRPDPTVWDGRFANNAWMQELPKPITKLTWDNAVYVSPKTARDLQLSDEDLVELQYRGRTVQAPVWVVWGHADDSFTAFLGYGREHGGRVAKGAGVNMYTLRTADAPWTGTGLAVRKLGQKYKLACTQRHKWMDGRYPVRFATAAQFEKDHDVFHKHPFEHAPDREDTLYPNWEYTGYAWGMAIDLNACVGCQACVVACNAENNIPVVGKQEVYNYRVMHWLRVDEYWHGDERNPHFFNQPHMCVHCENAPCEVVCPVAATLHNSEGLNEMVYNRCVGTRYCSNNCPYKVRRFNFLLYSDWYTPSLALMRNPDVTVRSRGVMEKCTYCAQRIQSAKIGSELQNRRIADGEIKTACQQACPADAIVFGDINDRNSRVSRLKSEHNNYGLLAELNTRPRTTYLARLRNPNPELETEAEHHA